jgi:hypothetical protein
VGSDRSSRVHTRSDAKERIHEATMWRRHCSREGKEEKHAELVSRWKKNHLVGLLFSFCQVQNSKLLERGYFLLLILFWKLANHKICQVKNSKLLEMLTLEGIRALTDHNP